MVRYRRKPFQSAWKRLNTSLVLQWLQKTVNIPEHKDVFIYFGEISRWGFHQQFLLPLSIPDSVQQEESPYPARYLRALSNSSCFASILPLVRNIFKPFCLLNACKSNLGFSKTSSKTQLLGNRCSRRPTTANNEDGQE